MASGETGAQAVGAPSGASSFVKHLRPHPPKPPKEQHSKSGRNLPAAIITGLSLLALVGLSLAFRKELFGLMVIVFLAIGIWEATGAFLARNIRIPLIPLVGAMVVMCAFTWTHGLGFSFVMFTASIAVVMLWRVLMDSNRAITDGIAAAFVLGWLAFSGCFAIAILAMPEGVLGIVALVLLPVASDTGGFQMGVMFGKHPIAASISPKKSWEGFLGSLILSLVASFLVVGFLMDLGRWWALLFGVVTPILATMGDFSESLLKRDLGIKDMGSIFPGHGGMLDRLDSILFVAPTFYLFFALAYDLL
ncbi:MAG: phosphatidate cytidylyltransferase [Actinomycetaceae bacterium]|nr:phosphatidate cytidylyltransferase [Arcanobacterium sp.]MDD7504512.1 phosphatidate cytidylyltransferase [Actinomycetaceae bacterium]MDY6142819.1 phosphatidate cytidylyltransferase [Arcanobacterium sp.]